MDKTENERREPVDCWKCIQQTPKYWVPLGLGAVMLVWLGVSGVVRLSVSSWEQSAQVGDTFGAVNALFSSLALLGVILTVWLQRQELKLQRQELVETRMELRRSAKAQEESAQALENQIRNQIVASRLDGLSTLVNAVDKKIDQIRQIEQHARGRNYSDSHILDQLVPHIDKRVDYLHQIETILKELECSQPLLTSPSISSDQKGRSPI